MLGNDVAQALPGLRAHAESRMLDTFDISIPAGGFVYDEVLKEDVEALEFLFSTQGRVKAGTRQIGNSEAGGRTVVTVTRELHIPVDSPAVPAGAVAICTSVDPTSDPTLLDAHLRLAGPAPGSQTTARRLEVTEDIA